VDALERITNLLALLLETRRPLTLGEIADALSDQYPEAETSRRTAFERDKAALRAEGVPIEQQVMVGDQAGQTGYWIDRARFEVGDMELSDEERRALHLAVAAVRLGTEWGDEALWKLGSAPGRSGGSDMAASLPSMPDLPTLFEAASVRSVVSFGYRSTPRELEPYAIVSRNGLWYLVGHDRDRGEIRTFRVDRFDPNSVRLGPPGAFERPVDLDLRSILPLDPKLMGERDNEPQVAAVLVSEARASLVESELGAQAVRERRPGGSIVVEVPCTNLQSFRHWALGLLEHAEVLGPPPVRADLMAWLERAVSQSATASDAEVGS
jgi:proteasome accessory factor B